MGLAINQAINLAVRRKNWKNFTVSSLKRSQDL